MRINIISLGHRIHTKIADELPRENQIPFSKTCQAFELALCDLTQLSPAGRGIKVCDAAALHSTEFLSDLIHSGEFSNEDRGIAAANAAAIGRLDALELLLNNGPISKHERALAEFEGKSYPEILQALDLNSCA